MRSLPVIVPTIKQPIQPSPGFEKKKLSTYKLDILALCFFACVYCSSNNGNYLRINRRKFAALAEEQLGQHPLPSEEPALTYVWAEILTNLTRQLSTKASTWGAGETLVFSMLTDAFSPNMVKGGITEAAVRLLLERTAFRVRILTKNAIVGSAKWIRLFLQFPGRVVVGLSIGTDDDEWARKVELGTSSPSSRLRAIRRLQEAGVPTYGMLCPIFPGLLGGNRLEHLVDQVRPYLAEDFWAEPYNDRQNWTKMRATYAVGSAEYEWFSEVYERGNRAVWSRYATEIYTRLRAKAEREGWLPKLKYLLYEGDITAADASAFAGLKGVLMQSTPTDEGQTKNKHIAAVA